MRSPPSDLALTRLTDVLADGWGLSAASLDYVPKGGGSHHWQLVSADGQRYFITVDDLQMKQWLGPDSDAAFEGLSRALSTAAALRYEVGLQFVIAPIPGRDGQRLRRIDGQHTVSVFRFLAGRSYDFGPYARAGLRNRVLDMIVMLHQATPAVCDGAPRHLLAFAGRDDVDEFLVGPHQSWDGGPFSEAAHQLLQPHAADLGQLITIFDRLVESTRPVRTDLVITHGEPHPANVMSERGGLVLIDWDTVALAPAERDMALILTADNEGADRYRRATGRELDPAVIELYRLRWYLDDIASATRLLRNALRETPDAMRSRHGLARGLVELPRWLDRMRRAGTA